MVTLPLKGGGQIHNLIISVHTCSEVLISCLQLPSAAAAAAAKLLQSCPTLCDPIDSSPSGSPRPWDSPGKNTGVGCHFLLQCRTVKRESEISQSYPTLSNPMDCSLPGSSIRGIFQARELEWGAIVNLEVLECRSSIFVFLLQYYIVYP